MTTAHLLVVLIVLVALIFDYTNGFHDAANAIATTVATMFKPHPNDTSCMVHERLEQEIIKQNEWARKSAEGGKKSAEMRKILKGGSTTLARVVEDCLPNGINQKATLQSSSSSSSSTTNNINRPDSVPEQVWNDFLKIRKAKKSPLTQTALNAIQNEADSAGWTLEDAITECVSRGWQGFKAEWVYKAQETYQRAC